MRPTQDDYAKVVGRSHDAAVYSTRIAIKVACIAYSITKNKIKHFRDVAQLVARVLWEHDVAGSNPVIPTISSVHNRFKLWTLDIFLLMLTFRLNIELL